MQKTINYKNHVIILDGITANLYFGGKHIYKLRFTNAFDAVRRLKGFINLRVGQIERDKSINIYA